MGGAGVSAWNVWRVFYATYAEVARDGDQPQQLVAAHLSFEAAKKLVGELGFGHCMKPTPTEP